MNIEERIERMNELRRQGYNCAQSTLMVFGDITGLDEKQAAVMTSALGAGVAGCGSICGVANAIAIAVGLTHGSEPSEKVAAAKEARPLVEAFAADNGGRLDCRDLKTPGNVRSCNELVEQGVRILHNHFASRR